MEPLPDSTSDDCLGMEASADQISDSLRATIAAFQQDKERWLRVQLRTDKNLSKAQQDLVASEQQIMSLRGQLEKLQQERDEPSDQVVSTHIRIQQLLDGYQRPVGKTDKCEHGQLGYEDCEACLSDYLISAAQEADQLVDLQQYDQGLTDGLADGSELAYMRAEAIIRAWFNDEYTNAEDLFAELARAKSSS